MAKEYTCNYCGAPIRFEQTAYGKVIAVDMAAVYYMPCETGGVLLLNGQGKYIHGIIGSLPDVPTRVADVPHFVTCRKKEIERQQRKAERERLAAERKAEEEQKKIEEAKRREETERKLKEKQKQLRFI